MEYRKDKKYYIDAKSRDALHTNPSGNYADRYEVIPVEDLGIHTSDGCDQHMTAVDFTYDNAVDLTVDNACDLVYTWTLGDDITLRCCLICSVKGVRLEIFAYSVRGVYHTLDDIFEVLHKLQR